MFSFGGFLKQIFEEIWRKDYRVRVRGRKLTCPHPDYPKAAITLPAEWLGVHAIRREGAIRGSVRFETPELTELSIALALVDEFENVPGIEGNDPSKWDLEKVPTPILAWLTNTVNADYYASFKLPKAFSPPSGKRSKVAAENGNLAEPRRSIP